MAKYIRNRVRGGTYFFTVVTERRSPILTTDESRSHLRTAIDEVRKLHPFTIDAFVLLPDHLHAIWTLPEGDDQYSLRWGLIKERFTRPFLASGGIEQSLGSSRRKHRERAVWQRRFWEHTVRDEIDLERCMDYIHWNPVKHGLVKQVRDYPFSSFHRCVRLGQYDPHWGEAGAAEIPGAEWE